MPRETAEERASRVAAEGPRAYCRGIREEIRRNKLLAGHDPGGRPSRLERLLTHVEEHLFEETLSVRTACGASGIADTAIASELRAYTGYTVDQLIARLRIEAGIHLVLRTRIPIRRLGELLGFRSYATFLRAYTTWTGETPEATRRGGGEPSAGSGSAGLPRLQRIGSGHLEAVEAQALRERLAELYPEVFVTCEEAPRPAVSEPAAPGLDAEVLERFRAGEEWRRLAQLPLTEQREIVRAWTFWTPGPFRFLQGKAREEGRRDKQRGVEVAHLALDALDGNEERLGPRVHELRAEGWAWLANAQRLDLDFDAAEASLGRAEDLLDAHDLRGAWVTGVFCFLKGTLRMFQQRHDEALSLFDQALPPFETAGDAHFQVRTLLQRIAALCYASRFDEVEPALRKAAALLQAAPDEALSFQIAYAAVSSLTRAGDFDRAEAYLQSLAAQISTVEEPVWLCLIEWAEALVDHGLGRFAAAEEKYLSSRRGFQSLQAPQYEASLCLDLAVLYSETGDSARVLEICPAICRFFEGLRLHDETLAALRLLRDATARAEVTAGVLRDLRSQLGRDPLAG